MDLSPGRGALSPAMSAKYDKCFTNINITEFPPLDQLEKYESISFDGCQIHSFSTMPKLPLLRRLCLDNTRISSFQKCQSQSKLSSISVINTPLEKYTHLNIMCVIALGDRIRRVNGKSLTSEEIHFGNVYRSKLQPYLQNGYMLLDIDPIKLFNKQTQDTKYITCLLYTSPSPRD